MKRYQVKGRSVNKKRAKARVYLLTASYFWYNREQECLVLRFRSEWQWQKVKWWLFNPVNYLSKNQYPLCCKMPLFVSLTIREVHDCLTKCIFSPRNSSVILKIFFLQSRKIVHVYMHRIPSYFDNGKRQPMQHEFSPHDYLTINLWYKSDLYI